MFFSYLVFIIPSSFSCCFFCVGFIHLLFFMWDVVQFFLAAVFPPPASTFCLLMLRSFIFKPNKYWIEKNENGRQQGKREWTILFVVHMTTSVARFVQMR